MDRFGYGYNFTDGIGKISKEKANEISMKYYKNKYVSTFQIRLGKLCFNLILFKLIIYS